MSWSSQYPTEAIAWDKTRVSDQVVAINASMNLEDLMMIPKTDTSNVIDKHKIKSLEYLNSTFQIFDCYQAFKEAWDIEYLNT